MPNTLEVRPFLPIDLPLLHRLTPFGMSFDSLTTLTRGVHTVEGAVWGAVPLGDLGTPTFILRSGESGYVAQFRHKTGEDHAHIVFIAPSLDQCDDEICWLRLLDAMTLAAGKRGALTLNAEVAETGDAFIILRQAGFATYARQEIWKREPGPLPSVPSDVLNMLRSSAEADTVALNSLHINTIPRMVRQADAPPDPKSGLVYEHEGRLAGYITAHEGKYGYYVQVILNPEVCQGQAQEIMVATLARLSRADKVPVYICVRRYQDWLSSALDRMGFEPSASQAVMVRHTVRRVEYALHKPVQTLDGVALALPRITGRREHCVECEIEVSRN